MSDLPEDYVNPESIKWWGQEVAKEFTHFESEAQKLTGINCLFDGYEEWTSTNLACPCPKCSPR